MKLFLVNTASLCKKLCPLFVYKKVILFLKVRVFFFHEIIRTKLRKQLGGGDSLMCSDFRFISAPTNN